MDLLSKNNSFIKGAAILGIAGVLVKILGAIYRIPLGNIIKAEGMGYYQTSYPIYMLLLTISTSGFPVAIAKLVSEKRAIEDYKGAYKVFKVSLYIMGFAGLLTAIYVFFRAEQIVLALGNRNAYYSLIALVPALFFTPIMAVFRGYFQGNKDMLPTAISQISEQFFRVLSGLLLTYLLLSRGIPIAAGAASFGGSVGAVIGLVSIYIIYLKKKESINLEIENSPLHNDYLTSDIIRDLLTIAIPITIGASIGPIMDTIDARLVLNRLQLIGYSEEMANELFGQLKGFAQTLINLPQVFSIAIAMSLVPAIADANARKEKKEVESLIGTGIRMTLLIGLPCSIGLFVLAKPIIALLFYSNTPEVINSTGEILMYLSFGVVFLTLVQSLTSILQGLGKPLIPVINLAIGAIVKVVFTYTLVVVPSINVKGAAISTVLAYGVASILNIIALAKLSKIKIDYKNIFLKPLIASAGMGIFAKIGYEIVHSISGNTIATIAGVMIGGISYLILLFVTSSIRREDLEILPKGERLISIMIKLKLIR